MASPAQPEEELADLRRRMVASAGRHLSQPDAEDVTQEALLRIVRDPRPSSVPLPRRAFRKLRDTRAELFRGNQRKFEAAAKPLEDAAEEPDEQAEAIADLIGLGQIVNEVAGAVVTRYVRLKAAGLTDAEIAEQPGWDTQRVDAARKKLGRKKAMLMKLIKESATE